MYISIQDHKEFDQPFLNYLKRRIVVLGLDYLGRKKVKLTPINKYLSQYVFTGVRKPSAEQMIMAGLDNIKFKKSNSRLIISLDESVKVPQYRTMLLDTVCRLIDQGNMELTPFPIFTYVFKYIQENLVQIYQDYSFGVSI